MTHEFSTPGIYVTDSWDVAIHYAMPTRRTVMTLCDFLIFHSILFLESRLGALGAPSWAPYIQCILEVQTRACLRRAAKQCHNSSP